MENLKILTNKAYDIFKNDVHAWDWSEDPVSKKDFTEQLKDIGIIDDMIKDYSSHTKFVEVLQQIKNRRINK